MEFLRWILILTGIAMLAAMFLLGRRKVDSIDYRRRLAEQDEFDPSMEELSVPIGAVDEDYETADAADADEEFGYEKRGYEEGEEFLSDDEIDEVIPDRPAPFANADDIDMGIEEAQTPAPRTESSTGKVKSLANAVKQASQRKIRAATSSDDMAEEFQPYAEAQTYEAEEKLVTLHITARNAQFSGNQLRDAFDSHGYSFGKMSIYHCDHEGQKVFSVANMVKPGTFDVDNLEQFSTPGITLFMRLPGSLDADVAFDFLIREATELAAELDGQLRDADRNTLGQQTIQHMHEDIQQYSFRQKTHAPA